MARTNAFESLDGGRIKGGILSAHLRWAEAELGAGWKAMLEPGLGGESAAVLRMVVLSSAWLPFRSLIEIDRAIAAAVGKPPNVTYRSLGRHSADWHLSGVYRNLIRANPHDFFLREAMHHCQYLDFGRAGYRRTGTNACRIELAESTCFSPVFCTSAIGYYTRVTELHGCTVLRIEETSCQCRGDRDCVYELSWR